MKNFPTRSAARLVLAALLLAACQKEDANPDNTPNLRPLSAAEQRTLSSANDFAYQAFGSLRRAEPQTNIFISPLSISAALTMAYNGADGSTKAAMKQTLGFQPMTDVEINQSYKSLFALLGGIDRKVTFTAANSIWYGRQYQLAAPFTQTNQTYFGATVQGTTFSDPAAATAMNQWVAANTQGKITRLIDGTNGDDVLYLINALYFKSAWTYKFDPQLTRPEPFHYEDGHSANTTFMTLPRGQYQYYTDAQQQVIDLPYGNRQYSMTLVIPQGNSTVADVSRRLSSTQLAGWLAKANPNSLELHLPKFSLKYKKTLNDMLVELGMGEAFDADLADFSRMVVNGPADLHISKVQHDTFLEVNEEGTEAAAATSVGMATTTSLPSTLLVNRPFVFLIREKSSNAVLFIGQLMNP